VGTEIFFGKSEIRLDSPAKKQPDGQIKRRPAQAFPSRLLQKLRAQHQALDLVGAAFDLVGIVGEVNASDHGAALEHGGGALQLQTLRLC